jgi:hypothetical protein
MNPPRTATAKKVDIATARAPGRGSEELISGSEAIAHAVRLADVDVITAYLRHGHAIRIATDR